MGIRHDLERSIHQVYQHNREGSFSTQAARGHMLSVFAKDLLFLGYALRDIRGLKQKHILAVVKYWQEKKLTVSTIKNRMAALRNLCGKINKRNIISSNAQMNIGQRCYKPTVNRAIYNPDFSKIRNEHVYVSLQLQRVFGLRREESLKIKPHMADRGERLELLPSWCKGGRGRVVPIRTEEQRYWLEQAKKLVEDFGSSLIPKHKKYIQQCRTYEKQVQRAGLRKLHGLRHAYAQARYKELTGWDSPICGGKNSRELSRREKGIDTQARLVLSEELGHSRIQITVNYCGR